MNYTIIIDEKERQIMAEAFAIMARKIGTCTPVIDAKPSADQTRAIATPKSSAGEVRAYAGPAAAPTPAPIAEERDRWARDRKGKELPNPEGCTAQTVHVWKVEQKQSRTPGKAPFWKVTWQSPTGKGYVDANCFDDQLAPVIMARQGKSAILHTVRSGDYLNVVGVRA